MVTDNSVLRGAEAAGVGRDISADAAILERGRIGREEEPVRGGEFVDAGGDCPGLHGRHCGDRIDLDFIPVV